MSACFFPIVTFARTKLSALLWLWRQPLWRWIESLSASRMLQTTPPGGRWEREAFRRQQLSAVERSRLDHEAFRPRPFQRPDDRVPWFAALSRCAVIGFSILFLFIQVLSLAAETVRFRFGSRKRKLTR